MTGALFKISCVQTHETASITKDVLLCVCVCVHITYTSKLLLEEGRKCLGLSVVSLLPTGPTYILKTI